jgi:hypothetical protein
MKPEVGQVARRPGEAIADAGHGERGGREQHQVEGGEDPEEPARVEPAQQARPIPVVAPEQDAGDQEPAEDEEEPHSPVGERRDRSGRRGIVGEEDTQHGERPQRIELDQMSARCRQQPATHGSDRGEGPGPEADDGEREGGDVPGAQDSRSHRDRG